MCECVWSVMYTRSTGKSLRPPCPLADVEPKRFARCGECRITADRGGVVDDAVKGRRQAEHLPQPAERDVFEFRRGGDVRHSIAFTSSAAASASARIVTGAALIEK